MPVAAALLKLALFALWALPTYKSTVEMLEMRERRLGILPKDTDATPEARHIEPDSAPASKSAQKKTVTAKKARATSRKQTRTT